MHELKRSPFEWMARFRPCRFTLLIGFIAVLGAAHILVRTATYGAAVTIDSTTYLSTAINFLAGEGWQHFGGGTQVAHPPFYSLLLAAFGSVGIEPLAAGRWVNAAAFGLTILVAGYWLRSNLRSRRLTLAAVVAVVVSLPLSHFASYFLTESLFVLFTLLALMQLESFLNRRTAYLPLMLAGVFTALAALTRYPGVVLIFTGVLLLLVRRAPPLAARLKHAVVFGVVSSIPLAALLTRNWAVSGTLTGQRTGSRQSLSDSLSQTVNVFSEWVVPPNAPDWFGYLLWTAAGLVVLAAVAVVVLSGRSFGMGGKRDVTPKGAVKPAFAVRTKGGDRTAPPSFGLGPAIPFGAFALGYLVFIVTVVPLVIPSGIVARFLGPLYVPLLLAAVFLLDRFLCIKAEARVAAARWVLASLVLMGALVHIGLSAQRNLILTAKAWVSGYENWTYNAAYWQNSETLKYIRDNRIDGRIYSRNPYLAWFADRTAPPGKHQNLPHGIPDLARSMMRWTEDGTAANIVWFNNAQHWDSSSYSDLDIRLLPGVEMVAELSDGVVFRVTAAEPFDADRHRARKERYVEGLIEQAGDPVARSTFDVYLGEGKLTYLKQPCALADTKAKFVVHVIPADPDDLPAHRKWYGYDNFGFYFDQRGVRLDDKCIMTIRLPDYAISRIRVGQWISAANRTIWEATFPVGR